MTFSPAVRNKKGVFFSFFFFLGVFRVENEGNWQRLAWNMRRCHCRRWGFGISCEIGGFNRCTYNALGVFLLFRALSPPSSFLLCSAGVSAMLSFKCNWRFSWLFVIYSIPTKWCLSWFHSFNQFHHFKLNYNISAINYLYYYLIIINFDFNSLITWFYQSIGYYY